MEMERMKVTVEAQLSKASRDKIKTYTAQIEKTWHKALESIFSIGDLLIEARKDFRNDKQAYDVLINQLSFGPRVAQRLVSIAETSFLRKSSVQKCLPPCWTTLNELRQLSEAKFNRAIKEKKILPDMTRDDAKAIAHPFSKQKQTELVEEQSSSSEKTSTYSNLVFTAEQSSDFVNQKALLDIQFICNLISDLFENSSRKTSVKVNSDCVKPSKKLGDSEKVFTDLIAATRKIENHNRKLQGKAPLNKLQEILTLLGVDPDCDNGKNGFSLLERLAVSYAKRHGITCIKADQLKWSAAKSDVEPELLGSFMIDVEKQVAKLTSGKSSKRSTTKIYELDSEADEPDEKSRRVFVAHRSH
jgi:hypothetical protein